MENVRVQDGGQSMRDAHRRKRRWATSTAMDGEPGQQFGPGPSAHMEGGRTARTQRMRSWLQGEPTGNMCGIPR